MSTQASVRVHCPHCSKRLSAPAALHGKTTTCPACGKTFILPAAPAEAVVLAQPDDIGARPRYRSNRRTWLIVAGAAGGVCLLGVCVLVGAAIFHGGTSPDQALAPGPLPSTPGADNKPGANPDQALAPVPLPSTPGAADNKPGMSSNQVQTPGVPSSFASDLDEMLHMLSHGVYVQDKLRARPKDAEWSQAMARLRSSPEPAVAAAAKASGPAALQRAVVRGIQDKLKAENDALNGQFVKSLKPLNFLADLELPSEAAIDAAFRRGDIDLETAHKLKAERARMVGGGGDLGLLGLTFFNSLQANEKIDAIRPRIEVLDAGIVASKLVDALRARGGAKVDQALLDVKLGVIGTTPNAPNPRALASIVSRADRELTRLTLLIEVDTPQGSRFISAHVPRLGPSEPFRIEPAALIFTCLNMPLGLQLGQMIPGKAGTKLRYSVWCDQFQIEQVEFAKSDSTDAVLAYGIHFAWPGAAYVSRKVQPGTDSRFGLTFTRLTRTADGYDVEALVMRIDKMDSARVLARQKYIGVVRGVSDAKYGHSALSVTLSPADKQNLLPKKDVKAGAKTTFATSKLDLLLRMEGDGRLYWNPFLDRAKEVAEGEKKKAAGLPKQGLPTATDSEKALQAMLAPGSTFKGNWKLQVDGVGPCAGSVRDAINAKKDRGGKLVLRIDSYNGESREVTATLSDPTQANVVRHLKGDIRHGSNREMILFFPGSKIPPGDRQIVREYLEFFTVQGDITFQIAGKGLIGGLPGPRYPRYFRFVLDCEPIPPS